MASGRRSRLRYLILPLVAAGLTATACNGSSPAGASPGKRESATAIYRVMPAQD